MLPVTHGSEFTRLQVATRWKAVPRRRCRSCTGMSSRKDLAAVVPFRWRLRPVRLRCGAIIPTRWRARPSDSRSSTSRAVRGPAGRSLPEAVAVISLAVSVRRLGAVPARRRRSGWLRQAVAHRAAEGELRRSTSPAPSTAGTRPCLTPTADRARWPTSRARSASSLRVPRTAPTSARRRVRTGRGQAHARAGRPRPGGLRPRRPGARHAADPRPTWTTSAPAFTDKRRPGHAAARASR